MGEPASPRNLRASDRSGLGVYNVPVPIEICGPLGCHMWRGATTPRGYPVMLYNGKTRVARRVFYEEAKGPIPKGYRVVMSCGERACVWDAHMELVRHNTTPQ